GAVALDGGEHGGTRAPVRGSSRAGGSSGRERPSRRGRGTAFVSDTRVLFDPPTALLKAVHDRMKELFTRYDALGPGDGWSKKGLFQVIRDILLTHMEIEETLFYPAVQGLMTDLAIDVVLRALRDHEHLKSLL